MRLYKMELYKLCHRKSFLAGFLFVLLIGLLFFYQELQHSYCVVNGTTYTGLRAIQMNRQITEEFTAERPNHQLSWWNGIAPLGQNLCISA